MKDAQKPDHVSLGTLISWLEQGRYVIPDFQRDFEWKPGDVRDLLRSIFLDYYIGSLLLWRGKDDNFDALACEPIYGFYGQSNQKQYIVLDGQQRLTALYYSFLAPDEPFPDRANRYYFFIHVDKFMDGQIDDAFIYMWKKNAKKIIENYDYQFHNNLFPLSIIKLGLWETVNWTKEYEKYWQDKVDKCSSEIEIKEAKLRAKDAQDFGKHLEELIQGYQISYIELDQDIDLSKVCDIFTQVNSKGVRLDAFDLINAMLKPKGLQLKHMWREVAPKLEFIDSDRMNVYLLQVMSIIRQTYCSPKYLYYLLPGKSKKVRDASGSFKNEILVSNVAEFEALWKESVKAVEKSIKLLKDPREFGAVSSKYLPYISILPVFSALQNYVASIDPVQQLEARYKIMRWYWASVFTSRYSGSVMSTAARDYTEVCLWIDGKGTEPSVIMECESQSLDLSRERKRGTSIYNGIFNLLVIQGAKDWITGEAPQYGDLDDHHILPKMWGQEQGLTGEIDTILNRTPLTPYTNRSIIRDSLPNEYLHKLIDKSGDKLVRDTLKSHLITDKAFDILLRSPFKKSDYKEFISAREEAIQIAIRRSLLKT